MAMMDRERLRESRSGYEAGLKDGKKTQYAIFSVTYGTSHKASSLATVAAEDQKEIFSLLEQTVRSATRTNNDAAFGAEYRKNMYFGVDNVKETGFYATEKGVITHQG